MIDAGRDLIVSLDNDNAAIGGALWLYASETETWKFVIAVPEVKSKGPKKTSWAVLSKSEKCENTLKASALKRTRKRIRHSKNPKNPNPFH